MSSSQIEAKVLKSGPQSTGLFIKAGTAVVKAEFSELAPCEFPPTTGTPISVEIPAAGSRQSVVGPIGRGGPRVDGGGYPNTVRFPVFTAQEMGDPEQYRLFASEFGHANASQGTLARVPLLALGTAATGRVDGEKETQTHCVLPVWSDGSSVLVTLDWWDGESGEGTPNPEWHLRASSGLPLSLGLDELRQTARLATSARGCGYTLFVSPWILGAHLLGDEGTAIPHRVWQREWRFTSFADFSAALSRLSAGLGGATSERPAAA